MRIALVGQPNSGKSTLFNAVAGYRSISANFPGSTVNYTISTTRVDATLVELVDLPGTYSLTTSNAAESATREYLLKKNVDAFVHVLDASMLSRGLELTFQLLEYRLPMVVCLNMIDDARRKGVEIDAEKLSGILGVPVLATIATQGVGIKELLRKAVEVAGKTEVPPERIRGHKDVEDVITSLSEQIEQNDPVMARLPRRLVAMKLLEGDGSVAALVSPKNQEVAAHFRRALAQMHGCESYEVIHSERHALAMATAEDVSTIGRSQQNFRDVLDSVLMHPFWGYVLLGTILYLFFVVVFKGGSYLEASMSGFFVSASSSLRSHLVDFPIVSALTNGLLQGVAGGVTLVLPYLIPFLLGLAFLEDLGYLPRVAFLMDGLMHRIGLHGTSLLPAVLGYGCNVPAVMATRILHTPRDRMIAAVISTLVPCSARTVVILGLIGYYLGPVWAFAFYAFNILVIALTGKALSRLMPQLTPGMILQIPRYQVPSLRSMLKKTWFRIRDFVMIAWPLLIAGSVVLTLGEFYGVNNMVDSILSPLTVGLLGLPVAVGTTLIFGVLRKELSLLMLGQALGTANIASALSSQQIVVFTVFIMFYIPCVATIGVMMREIGARITLFTIVYSLLLAIVTAVLSRLLFAV